MISKCMILLLAFGIPNEAHVRLSVKVPIKTHHHTEVKEVHHFIPEPWPPTIVGEPLDTSSESDSGEFASVSQESEEHIDSYREPPKQIPKNLKQISSEKPLSASPWVHSYRVVHHEESKNKFKKQKQAPPPRESSESEESWESLEAYSPPHKVSQQPQSPTYSTQGWKTEVYPSLAVNNVILTKHSKNPTQYVKPKQIESIGSHNLDASLAFLNKKPSAEEPKEHRPTRTYNKYTNVDYHVKGKKEEQRHNFDAPPIDDSVVQRQLQKPKEYNKPNQYVKPQQTDSIEYHNWGTSLDFLNNKPSAEEPKDHRPQTSAEYTSHTNVDNSLEVDQHKLSYPSKKQVYQQLQQQPKEYREPNQYVKPQQVDSIGYHNLDTSLNFLNEKPLLEEKNEHKPQTPQTYSSYNNVYHSVEDNQQELGTPIAKQKSQGPQQQPQKHIGTIEPQQIWTYSEQSHPEIQYQPNIDQYPRVELETNTRNQQSKDYLQGPFEYPQDGYKNDPQPQYEYNIKEQSFPGIEYHNLVTSNQNTELETNANKHNQQTKVHSVTIETQQAHPEVDESYFVYKNKEQDHTANGYQYFDFLTQKPETEIRNQKPEVNQPTIETQGHLNQPLVVYATQAPNVGYQHDYRYTEQEFPGIGYQNLDVGLNLLYQNPNENSETKTPIEENLLEPTYQVQNQKPPQQFNQNLDQIRFAIATTEESIGQTTTQQPITNDRNLNSHKNWAIRYVDAHQDQPTKNPKKQRRYKTKKPQQENKEVNQVTVRPEESLGAFEIQTVNGDEAEMSLELQPPPKDQTFYKPYNEYQVEHYDNLVTLDLPDLAKENLSPFPLQGDPQDTFQPPKTIPITYENAVFYGSTDETPTTPKPKKIYPKQHVLIPLRVQPKVAVSVYPNSQLKSKSQHVNGTPTDVSAVNYVGFQSVQNSYAAPATYFTNNRRYFRLHKQ